MVINMPEKRYNITDIAKKLELEPDRIKDWCERELIVASKEGGKEFFVEEDLERFRVIKNLIDDLEVNIEGVEVILGMRNKMIGMELWIREVFKILDEHKLLNEELVEKFKKF